MPTIDKFPSRHLFSCLPITSLLGVYYNNVILSRYKDILKFYLLLSSLEVEEMMDSNVHEPYKNIPLQFFFFLSFSNQRLKHGNVLEFGLHVNLALKCSMNLKLFWLTHPRQKNVLPSYISHFEKNVSKK